MADIVTKFEADEGVNRANFNSRIDEINNGMTQLRELSAAAQKAAETAVVATAELVQ